MPRSSSRERDLIKEIRDRLGDRAKGMSDEQIKSMFAPRSQTIGYTRARPKARGASSTPPQTVTGAGGVNPDRVQPYNPQDPEYNPRERGPRAWAGPPGSANRDFTPPPVGGTDSAPTMVQASRESGLPNQRELESIAPVQGYEDRPTGYNEALQQAVGAGIYQEGMDDSVFDRSLRAAPWARKFPNVRGMEKWQLKAHMDSLQAEVEQFEQVRQQLTQSYDRMDPFARTQYKDMERKLGGLQRAYASGHVNQLEYMREMARVAEGAKQIKWKYHFKAPGGEVGDVISPQNNGMVYQRQPDGALELHYLEPQFIQQNTMKLGDNKWRVPTIVKGKLEYETVESEGPPPVDYKERLEWKNEVKDLEKKYMEEGVKKLEEGADGFETMDDVEFWARQKAIQVVGQYKSAADSLSDPRQQDPTSDPAELMKQRSQMKKEAAFQKGQLDAKQRAISEMREARKVREAAEEARAPLPKLIEKRQELFSEFEQRRVEALHEQAKEAFANGFMMEAQKWMEENPEWVRWKQWKDRNPDSNVPEPETTRPKPKYHEPKKPKAMGPVELYGRQVKETIDSIRENGGDQGREITHALSLMAQGDEQFKLLYDNPIPMIASQREKTKDFAKQVKDGYFYLMVNDNGQQVKLYRFGGKWYQASEIMGTPIQEEIGAFGKAAQQTQAPFMGDTGAERQNAEGFRRSPTGAYGPA